MSGEGTMMGEGGWVGGWVDRLDIGAPPVRGGNLRPGEAYGADKAVRGSGTTALRTARRSVRRSLQPAVENQRERTLVPDAGCWLWPIVTVIRTVNGTGLESEV